MNNTEFYPLFFKPIYQYRLWGGRKLADIDRALRLFRSVDVWIDNAHRAVIKQQRHVGVIDPTHPHQRRDPAGHRRADNVADGLDIEKGMLAVDKDEVVAGRFGDAGDVAGSRKAHRHAERGAAGLHALTDWVCKFSCIRHDVLHNLFLEARHCHYATGY